MGKRHDRVCHETLKVPRGLNDVVVSIGSRRRRYHGGHALALLLVLFLLEWAADFLEHAIGPARHVQLYLADCFHGSPFPGVVFIYPSCRFFFRIVSVYKRNEVASAVDVE